MFLCFFLVNVKARFLLDGLRDFFQIKSRRGGGGGGGEAKKS